MIQEVLFTHNDMDGAGCRIVFELFQNGKDPTTWKVYNCSNNGVDDTVRKAVSSGELADDATIFFGDICCSRDVLQELLKKYPSKVHVFDHHRSNFWVVNDIPTARIVPEDDFGTMQSGTSLLYQFLAGIAVTTEDENTKVFTSAHPNSNLLSEFVDTIRSYDTFEWKKTNNMQAKHLQILYQLLGMTRFCSRYINYITNISDEKKPLITPVDMEFITAKLDAEQARIDRFTPEDVINCIVRGHKTALALSTFGMNFSELAYQFLRKYPEYDLMATFSFSNGGSFEFRTAKEDFDIATEIAVPIHGGGHAAAAGAPICDELRDIFIEYLIAEMNGEPCKI